MKSLQRSRLWGRLYLYLIGGIHGSVRNVRWPNYDVNDAMDLVGEQL